MITKYRPNFADARVKRRLTEVLAWTKGCLSTSSPVPVHHDQLRQVFGCASHSLTRYLRANLLIQTGQYQKGRQSYSYLLNQRGWEKLYSEMEREEATQRNIHTIANGYHKCPGDDSRPSQESRSAAYLVITSMEKRFRAELETCEFQYNLKSNRYWHPLQNLRREFKDELWSRYLPWDYDIQACAPTVLSQLALRAGLPPAALGSVQAYLDDRSGLRSRLASLCSISERDAKKLINSLFNGARLAANGHCSAFRVLEFDKDKMRLLQEDAEVKQLRAAIKRIWQRIAERYQVQVSTSSQKWQQYFAIERAVLDCVREFCATHAIKVFTEHDGWRTNRELDVPALKQHIKQRTGFDLTIDGRKK